MTAKPNINPRDIPGELLEKYQSNGPRYTSYPTAPQFTTGIDNKTLIRLWNETNTTNNGVSIYTHFPFCKSRCLYCGCFTHTDQPETIKEQYLEALKLEIDRLFIIVNPSHSIQQLTLGGGTPTHLQPKQLSDYIDHLSKTATFHPEGERSIEVDPRSVDEAYLEQLLQMGFNRISFGVQDLNPAVQKNINRILAEEKLKDLVTHLRKKGLEAINFDLIYGLPGQTKDSFADTIRKINILRPSRIALFGYAHVPWVSPHQKLMENLPIPNPQERMEIFGIAFDLLLQAGYLPIGMDHFALPHDELVKALNERTLTRNFMGYTTRRGLDLVGIGASSISSVGITYTQNEKNLSSYLDNSQKSHWQKGLILSPEDTLRREIILELFCNFYLDIPALEKKYSLNFARHFAAELEALKPIEQDGLMQIQKDNLSVTKLGRFFIRNICMQFDQYLTGENREKRYSKTL